MQKFLFALIIIVSFAGATRAQDHRKDNNNTGSQPPPAVQKSFQNDHPGVKDVNWQRSNQQWHSSHTDPGTHLRTDSYYDGAGSRVDSHKEIGRRAVPPKVDQHIHDRYHADDYAATRIDRPQQSPVFSLYSREKNTGKFIPMKAVGR